MAREFVFKGKSIDELKTLTIDEFSALIGSRARRSLKRGLTTDHKKLMEKVNQNNKNIRTHARDMVILPQMVGHLIKIHNGKEFIPVQIVDEMVGHFLGEFSMTRKRITHNAPGVGATRSSSAISVR